MKANLPAIIITFFLSFSPCYSADLLFVDIAAAQPSIAEQQLQLACRLYGLDSDIVTVYGENETDKIASYLQENGVYAIIITTSALNKLETIRAIA